MIKIAAPNTFALNDADKARALDQPGAVTKPRAYQPWDAMVCTRCKKGPQPMLINGRRSGERLCQTCADADE